MAERALPKIARGKRAIIAGRTGSGKSTLANWFLMRSPGHWLILNPKWTKSYNALPDSVTVDYNGAGDFKKVEKGIMTSRYTVLQPSSHAASHDVLDDIVMVLHERYEGVGLCVDELYSMHNAGRAGEGLLGWLTRGRELHQSFLGLTQRPSWLTQFLFSESDYIGGMSLGLEDDRKRMVKMTGHAAFERNLPPHFWLWYDAGKHDLRKFGPVPLPA